MSATKVSNYFFPSFIAKDVKKLIDLAEGIINSNKVNYFLKNIFDFRRALKSKIFFRK